MAGIVQATAADDVASRRVSSQSLHFRHHGIRFSALYGDPKPSKFRLAGIVVIPAHVVHLLQHMEHVQYLDSVPARLVRNVPDPRCAVAENHLPIRLEEAATRRFARKP